VAREVAPKASWAPGRVPGVAGTWKDLTDNVNPWRVPHRPGPQHRRSLHRHRERDLSADHGDVKGGDPAAEGTINTMVDQLRSFASEVTRVRARWARSKLGARPWCRASPAPGKLTDSVNSMAVTSPARCATSRSRHRHRQTATCRARSRRREGRDPAAEGDHQHDGRSAQPFAAEVTRVAREVGSEGKLGGQADVKDVSGV